MPNITSFGPPNGPQIPFDTYHLTSQAVALADALPLLSDLIITIFFPTLPTHQQAARTMLTQDASPATFPDDAFVFHLHPDDYFVFFRTSEGDDPPVYAHKRDWRVKPFQKIFYRFSDFLAIQLALYATYQQPQSMPTAMREKDYRDRFLAMQERIRKTREHQPSQE